MQRMKRILFSGLIALFVLFGLILPQGVEARDIIINDDPVETTLAMDPSTATATTCGTVDVNVWVDDVVNLTAFHLEVTYDRTKVQVVSVVNGGFLASPAENGLLEPTNTLDDGTGTGRLLFGMAQQGVGGDPNPKTGSGNLIKITLKSLATSGTTELAVDGTKSMLVDWPDAQSIPFTVTGSTTVTLQSCAPTDITLINATVNENLPAGTLVGTLGASDPDVADTTFTYSLVDTTGHPDNAKFQIVGSQLQTNAIFDFETDNSYEIMIRATGPNGLTYDEAFTIAVNDVNDAPVLAVIGAKSVVNTGTLTFTATATDQDLPAQTLIFSVKDAPTAATINATTGVFSWSPTVATDAGIYYATVCVSDWALEDCETITITVTDGEAPTVISGVAHGVAPYGDVAMVGTSFTVPQGFVVSTIQFTISEPVTIVGSNVVYMGTVPYGTMAVLGDVITVTPNPNNEIAAQLGTFTFNVDAGSIEDAAGNALTTLSATLTVTDQTNPVMEAVTPAEGLVTLGLDDTFILTVDAFDLNLYSLEVDHSFEGTLPEFTVYASATNPWGSTAAKDAFDAAGMTVAYDETAQKWTINFGEAITDTHFIPNGVTFYMVLHDEADNKWGSMSPTTDENTFEYTFEVTNTLEEEIASAPSYVYDPAYTYAGDTVFTDSSNLYTMTYSPAEFLAGGAMNDLARYLGALNYQSTSTIIKITYKGVVYTWDPDEPNTGSNWYNGATSLVSAMVADYLAAPGDLVITVGDGWHTSNVTFRLLITNTLDAEVESAPSYVYDPVYTYVGTRVFDDTTNLYTVTYNDVEFDPNAMYDLARYLGALHRQDGATVTSIVFNGVTYTWDPTVGLLGSNWVDGSDNTLVSAVVAGISSYNPAVGLVFTVADGVHTETVTFKFVVTDTTAPTIVSGVAVGTTGFDPVTADDALTFTVPQGYTVDHIEITMSEAVQIVAPGIVYFEGNPYGTMTASGSVLTITPYAGNAVAGIPGTFDFTIAAGSVQDLAGNNLATLTATMVVEPSPIFGITDFGMWGDVWPGAYSLGWGYVPLFDTTTIASIEVGMLDVDRESIVTYTADDEQIVWQLANGWIPTPPANLSSAPFYRVYNGNPIAEGSDLDWTVIFGAAFDAWSPRWGYVKVTDIYGTVVTHELEYTGTLGDLTAPTVGEATAVGVDPYDDVTADDALTFTVPQGYTVEKIDFTMSEAVTVVTGTEVTLAGVPYGLVTVSTDGLTLTVTPYTGNTVANLIGTFSFNVPDGKIFDFSGNPLGTLSATLIVTNVAPVAVDDSYSVAEDGVLTVAARGVLINDTDFDPSILTAVKVTDPANGTLTLNADGSFTYTPAANFNGTDSFTYKANDGLADSNVATVTITIASVNDAPLLALIGPQTVANTDTLSITPSASDADGDTLTWSLGAGAPAGATIDPATGAFSWAPGTTMLPGNYSATICVSDGTFQDCETVTINVTDGVAPILTSVTPPEGNVYLKAGENFVLTVDALDDNLRELEIDHSMQGGGLPEFSVYASESDPYGGDEADFALLGVTVIYNATTQTWTIDFGAAITTTFTGNPDGITFYLVLKDETGNTWGSMYSTTPENTFEYNLILDDVAPVMEAVTPAEGDVYLAGGENFVLTIDALDTNLYSLEIDHSMEGSLPEFTVYADSANPYGSAEAKTAFESQGVFVTYDSVAQVWTIDFGAAVTNLFIANPNGITFYMVLKDLAGNTWGSMDPTTADNTYEYNLIRDDVAPVLVSVTPPHDSTVLLGIGDTFKLTIVADDDNLQKLELDHSMEGTLPEFSVYASESDPYGGDGADFATAGVTVTYDAATQAWVIDFGASVSGLIANNGGITFYLVLEDMAGNTWGSMSPTTTANTFKYTVSQDLVVPTISSIVATGAAGFPVETATGTTLTVDQGYQVATIDITMSEPVVVALGTQVTITPAGGIYGTVTAVNGAVITITPLAGNETAGIVGTFTFTVPAGAVEDLSGNPWANVPVSLVVEDVTGPEVTIIEATADGDAMAGNLEDGYILPTTNDPAIDHLLQIDANVDEALATKYNGLYFVEGESTVTAAQLKAYYDARGVPSTPLDFLGYLKGAADGTNPFVYLKEDALSLSLVDAAKHALMGEDVDMTIPDNFPLGTYVVRGVVADANGNQTTVTFTLIVTGDRLEPVVSIIGATADGDAMSGNLEHGYILPTTNDPAIDHLLQINATVDAPLADEYFGLMLIDSTVSAEDLKAYYTAKPVPEPYLSYLNSAADGVNPFVYIKGDGLVLSLVDAAKHDLGGVDVPMTVPDTFPLGTYTVQGVVRDLAGNQTTVTFILIVTGDRVEPVVTIIGATADGDAMSGNLEDGYILEITNDPAADDHLLQIDATVNEPLADEFFGLYFVESESTVTAAQLKAYYDARGVPSTPLDFLGYLKGAADGTNPFVFIKEDALSLNLVDAAKHALMGEDVDMTIPDNFPVGKYVVRGVVADADGNETTVTLILIVRWTEETALAWLQDNTVLSSVTGMVDDLTATFPLSIPPVIVEKDYVIDSRMTLAAPLPAGSTITVFRDGVQILTDITLSGTGPFWFTELFTPDAPRAGFNDNYAEQVENYSIIVTGPAGLAADFDTTVLIESVISKDGYLTETVLDDIILGIHLDDAVAPAIGSGVAKSATDGNVNLVDGKFTVNQGFMVDTIDITMNEPVLVEIGTVVTMVGYGPYGTITANADGVITITPYAGNEIAALIGSFSFTAPVGAITDLNGNPFNGSIGLEVLNVAPVAVNDAYTTDEDVVLTVPARGVLTNDTDYDPSILTAVKVTDPANGTLVLSADGSFTYTPAANFNGTDSFTYKANDGLADSNVATVTITVTAVNDAPVLGSIADATIPEMVEFSFTATATDVDLPAPVLTFSLVGAPEGAAITQAGVFTWTPGELQGPGVYTFTVKVCDDATPALCDEQSVTLTVTEVNVAPVAQNQTVTTAEDTPLDITLVATDAESVTLTYSIVALPAHGTVTVAGNVATYTPVADYNGPDSFTFKANDGTIDSNVATVTITVTPVNDTPVAVDDEYEVDEDGVLTIGVPGVLGNDTDIDLDNMVVALVSTVSHGELVLLGDGSFTYTPAPDFYGEDSFVYELVSYPAIQAGWKDTATVTITVNPINDAPVAQSQSVTTPEETAKVIPLVATDIENDSLTYEIAAQPAHGTVTLVGTTATYTPNLNFVGEDSFTFKAKDATLDSNVATVTITITPVNDAPVAVDDAYTMAEKETLTIAAPGVLDNDSDVDGDILTVTLVDTVQHGTLTLNADGSFTYTPNEYFNSTDSFTYLASDGTLESELAIVVITVTPVNDWPIANDDSYETLTGVLLDVAAPGVLGNDVLLDPDEVVSITILDAPQHGTLSMNDDGSFTYTPDAGFMGTDTFRYQLNSVQLHAEWSDDALVTIVVKPYMGLFLPIIWR